MLLITSDQNLRLDRNGEALAARRKDALDLTPPLKLFTPWGGATWLLVSRDPDHHNILFGLCDLGLGYPELGDVDLDELKALQGPWGLRVERDIHWTARKRPLRHFYDEAMANGRIVA